MFSLFFSSPEHGVLSELLRSITARQCPSILIFLVNTLASTNINQSSPNLVAMYMSIRSQMSLIMGQVIPDQSVLYALEIEKLNLSSLFGIYLHY